jgi:diguanylate cyclase (GGDEF)-like protein
MLAVSLIVTVWIWYATRLAVLDAELSRQIPWFVLIAGSAASLLVFVLIALLTRQRAQALALVRGMASDLQQSKQQLKEQLEQGMDDLRQRNYEIALHAELTNFLQSSYTSKEAYMAIVMTGRRLFPHLSGALYASHEPHGHLELALGWGDAQPEAKLFSRDECWALRREKMHRVCDTKQEHLCGHLQDARELRSTLCVPMIAQHELLGLLCIVSTDGRISEREQDSANTLAEHASIGLANVRLREALRHQSNHDPLTGLLNRRYLDDVLPVDLVRAKRRGTPVSVILLDVDHFKRYNDTHGHEAGDVVLRELAQFLISHGRRGDSVFRYGGEEFLLVLPDTPLAGALELAERMHEGVRLLKLEYAGQPLATITLSLGVATCPDHAAAAKDLIRAADRALYLAKNTGRDRVVTATAIEPFSEGTTLKRIV